MTQGRKIIDMLKRKPMTSMEILQTGISTCWWKRLSESLQPGEKLLHGPSTQHQGKINVYMVVKDR